MPSVQTYLTLENSVAAKLRAPVEREARGFTDPLIRAVRGRQYAEAYRIIDGIGFSASFKEAETAVRLVWKSALLYGASWVAPARKSLFFRSDDPPVLRASLEMLRNRMTYTDPDSVKARARKVVQDLELADPLTPISKSADSDLADALNAAVLGTGRALVDIGANLSTSRLVTYGFLAQAQNDGLTEYQITEELDERTCKFCRGIHGRVFKVSAAFFRVEQLLLTTDPTSLKALAPFPKQDKESLADYASMTDEELVADGLHMPPFHPLCRGQVVPVGQVPESERGVFEVAEDIEEVEAFHGAMEKIPVPKSLTFDQLPEKARAQFGPAFEEHELYFERKIKPDDPRQKYRMSREDARQFFTAMYEEAKEVVDAFRPSFEVIMEDLQGMVQPGELRYGRIKSPESIAGKLLRKPGGDIGSLTDIIGTTLRAGSLDRIDEAIADIQSRYTVLELDDKREKPPYRAVHLLIDVGGKPVELQIKTHNQLRWSALSHSTLYSKEENLLKGEPDFGKYMVEMSDYLWDLDRGIDPGPAPKCPTKVRLMGFCFDQVDPEAKEFDPPTYQYLQDQFEKKQAKEG